VLVRLDWVVGINAAFGLVEKGLAVNSTLSALNLMSVLQTKPAGSALKDSAVSRDITADST